MLGSPENAATASVVPTAEAGFLGTQRHPRLTDKKGGQSIYYLLPEWYERLFCHQMCLFLVSHSRQSCLAEKSNCYKIQLF